MSLTLGALIEKLESSLAVKPAEDNETYDAARDIAYIHQI
jgi:hypothetical protein